MERPGHRGLIAIEEIDTPLGVAIKGHHVINIGVSEANSVPAERAPPVQYSLRLSIEELGLDKDAGSARNTSRLPLEGLTEGAAEISQDGSFPLVEGVDGHGGRESWAESTNEALE